MVDFYGPLRTRAITTTLQLLQQRPAISTACCSTCCLEQLHSKQVWTCRNVWETFEKHTNACDILIRTKLFLLVPGTLKPQSRVYPLSQP